MDEQKVAHGRFVESVEYLRFKGIAKTQGEIARVMGMLQPHVSKAISGDPKRFTSGFLKRFADAYADYINKEWLLTGRGQMAVADAEATRPHIPRDVAEVSAGFTGVAISTVLPTDAEPRPVNPQWGKYDMTVTVKGDSMYPTLEDGDVIACHEIGFDEPLSASKIYVVDTDDGAVVKRVTRGRSALICRSDNKNGSYPDIRITAGVRHLYEVVGLSRAL